MTRSRGHFDLDLLNAFISKMVINGTQSTIGISLKNIRVTGRIIGNMPSACISMIGRDCYGGDLLADCLTRIAGVAEQIGTAVVILEVLDCGDVEKTKRRADLYTAYGFQPLPSMPLRMFLPVATIKGFLEQPSNLSNAKAVGNAGADQLDLAWMSDKKMGRRKTVAHEV